MGTVWKHVNDKVMKRYPSLPVGKETQIKASGKAWEQARRGVGWQEGSLISVAQPQPCGERGLSPCPTRGNSNVMDWGGAQHDFLKLPKWFYCAAWLRSPLPSPLTLPHVCFCGTDTLKDVNRENANHRTSEKHTWKRQVTFTAVIPGLQWLCSVFFSALTFLK